MEQYPRQDGAADRSTRPESVLCEFVDAEFNWRDGSQRDAEAANAEWLLFCKRYKDFLEDVEIEERAWTAEMEVGRFENYVEDIKREMQS